MNRDLFYVGITHRTVPVATRERMGTDNDIRRVVLAHLAPLAVGRTILATCERFEIYAMTAMREVAV